jgi:hypothetical protein
MTKSGETAFADYLETPDRRWGQSETNGSWPRKISGVELAVLQPSVRETADSALSHCCPINHILPGKADNMVALPQTLVNLGP